jgi:precorrin-4/cobalt-precorrin-4 C11-methyltransferase
MGQIDAVADILGQAYGADAACAVVYRASQPDEKVIRTQVRELAARVRAEGITRQALIIVGRVLEVGLADLKIKSKLYDKNFEHGFRS